jgi:hypothetical protein
VTQPPINDIAALDRAEDVLVEAMVTEDGRARFKRTIKQCNVCMSEDFRVLIESWFTCGMKSAEIIERIGPDTGISERSIDNHFARHHCTLDAALKQLPYWKKAFEQGIDLHSFDEQMSRALFSTELIVDQFMRDVVEGRFAPDSKDFLKAISMLWEMEKDRAGSVGEFDPQHMFIVIRILMEHVRTLLVRYVPEEMEDAMAYFNRRLQGDPILKDLIAQTQVSDVMDDDGFADEEPVPIVPNTRQDDVVAELGPPAPVLLPEAEVEDVDWNETEPWE